METPAFIRNSIRPMHWGVSLDLEDAFFHVPIHPNFSKYLRFAFQGQFYQFWGHALWFGHSPLSFYQAHGGSLCTSQGSRSTSTSVLRRLAHSPARSSTTPSEPRVCLEGTSILRTPSQCKQVRPHSFPRFYFRGNEFSDPPQPVRVSRQRVPDLIARVKWVLTQSYITAQDFLSQWYPELCSRLSATRMVVSPSSAALPVISMGLVSRQSAGTNSYTTTLSAAPSMVTTFLAPHNRSEQGRLGSSFGTTQSDSFRHVVPSGVSSAHQQPGNESCSISSHQFPGTSSGLVRDVVHRQHISRLLRSGSGRNTLTLPLPGDQGSAGPLSGSEHIPLSQTHTRSPQCPVRRSVSKTPATSFGVDSPSGSGQPDLFLSRSSPRRSVCNQGQQQITSVRKSSLRCSSMGSRRTFVRVGPTGSLRLSPTHSHSPDSGENQGERLPDSPCRPLVAQETLVQHNSRSSVRLPKETTSQARPSVPERQTSCRPRHVPLTRLAVIRRSLQKKRFSA